MKTKPSLFSRAKPGTKTPVRKKRRGFLDLPSELRNEVYRFYFPDDIRCELVAAGTDFDPLGHKIMKLGLIPVWPCYSENGKKPKLVPFEPRTSMKLRISRRLATSKYERIDWLRTKWPSSFSALILVSKQIYQESIAFLYQSTTFVFSAPVRINNFLKVLPATNLALITKLELHYNNYGPASWPPHIKDVIGQHRKAWAGACKTAAKQMVNLRELHMWMYITDSPLFFDLRQDWLTPFLSFRRWLPATQTDVPNIGALDAKVGTDKGLALVNVYFDTWWSRPDALSYMPELPEASADLHNLFGKAIGRTIMGASEEEAMAEFREAWDGKYAHWKHHLRFSTTGW